MTKQMTDSELLQALIAKGHVTEAELREIAGPSAARLRLVKAVHTLFCPKEEAASFYQEELQKDSWRLAEHMKWERVAIKLLQQFSITSDDEALEQLNNAMNIARTSTATAITLAYYVMCPELLLEIIDEAASPTSSGLLPELNQGSDI